MVINISKLTWEKLTTAMDSPYPILKYMYYASFVLFTFHSQNVVQNPNSCYKGATKTNSVPLVKFHFTFFIVNVEIPPFKTYGNYFLEKLGHNVFLTLAPFLGQHYDLGGL